VPLLIVAIVADSARELHPMNMGFPMTPLPRIVLQRLVIPFGSAGYDDSSCRGYCASR